MDGETGLDSNRRVRRAAATAIALAYALSVAVFAVRLLGTALPMRYGIAGAVSLAVVMAVPPTLALLALRGRTALFLPAALIAFAQSPILYILGVIVIVGAFIWFWAYLRLGNELGFVRTVSAVLVVGILWIAAAATLFVRIDPVCVEWLTDGTVRPVSARDQGFTSGWAWNQPNTATGGSPGSVDVVRSVCSSDILTPIEAAVALALSLGAVGAGMAIVTSPPADPSATSP
jgi:hypothetical protein